MSVQRDEAVPVEEPRIYSLDDAIIHGNIVNETIVAQWLPVWTRNAFAHHRFIDPTRQNLRNLFDVHKDQTAIIVSTGPSLDRNLEELEAIPRDRFTLIATTSALNPVIAAGFTPEYAAINDGQPWIADLHYAGLRDFLGETTLICSTMAHPSTALEWPGPRVYYNDFGPEIPLMGTKGSLSMVYPELWNIPVSGCTTNLALRAAFLIGFSKMVLIGTDLAFSGRSAHGTKYERKGSTWTPKPKSEDFFIRKARWIMRTCWRGCEHVVQEWTPSMPLEPASDRFMKCQFCKELLRHCPTSAEYLFYYRNLLTIAQTGGATLRNPNTNQEEPRTFEVINATGDGIAVNLKNQPLAQVFA